MICLATPLMSYFSIGIQPRLLLGIEIYDTSAWQAAISTRSRTNSHRLGAKELDYEFCDAIGEKGSTILLHIVTHICWGKEVLCEIVS